MEAVAWTAWASPSASGEMVGHDDVMLLPEGVAGPQSVTLDVDLVEALPVSSRGPSPAEAVQGEEASIMAEVM